jgi:hypothetical protein
VGASVGAFVIGTKTGEDDGLDDGVAVGFLEGLSVGLGVGDSVGFLEGACEGDVVGDDVGPMIDISNTFDAVSPFASETVNSKERDPDSVGVPEIHPSTVSDIPENKLPEVKLQVYGSAPPIAVSINM